LARGQAGRFFIYNLILELKKEKLREQHSIYTHQQSGKAITKTLKSSYCPIHNIEEQ